MTMMMMITAMIDSNDYYGNSEHA
uniref:Uncharacterized protein n=1 Tax=Brugia malayi TaxID=6279 RepID=A8NF91_BRUMA